jgi:RNA polymerase subunit RPABC4/transcription elongation factor Spt4
MYINIKCDSWVIISELEMMIAKELGIKTPKIFGLYEVLSTGEDR